MRIISGKHRGRLLSGFKGESIRPTADRAKEALFNIYKDQLLGRDFLDLFCGSGNVGIEALSRGASVVMCDVSAESVALTKKNLDLLGENCPVCKMDALDFLSSTTGRFDYIFIDPPYKDEVGLKALAVIGDRGLLKDGGIAIYERDREVCAEIKGLKFIRSRKYGKAVFNFYGRAENV